MERIQVKSEFVVVTSFDEKYAKLGMSMIASVWKNNDFPIHFIVFDTGIRSLTIRKLEKWAKELKIDLTFSNCDYFLFSSFLESSDNLKHDYRYYVRLIAPYIVNASRILYMDADIICLSSLRFLFEMSLNNYVVAASRDSYFVQFDIELKNWNKTVVNNYEELGLPGNSPYFNSGVLLIDTEKWINFSISENVVALSKKHHDHVFLWDQYGLNIALHGKWIEIDYRWNFTSECYNLQYVANRHFAKIKPTNYFYAGNDRSYFYFYLDMTPFKGWRPSLITAYFKKIERKVAKIFR